MTTSPVQAVVAEMRTTLCNPMGVIDVQVIHDWADRLDSAQAAGAGVANPAFVGEWHRRAVELGYDGVSELIAFALPCIVNSGGDERPTPIESDAGLSERVKELEAALKRALTTVEHHYHTNPDPNGFLWADVKALRAALGEVT